MRDLGYLVRLFPDKTGKELMAIQEQDKLEDELEYQKLHEADLKFIADINTNGGFYCGRFGLDQRNFYRIFNLRMEDERVMMDVEKLYVYLRLNGEVNIERRIQEYQKLDSYGLSNRDRVTKKEWDEVNEHINSVGKFWDHIKQV